jgi:hypothetical protein
MTSLQGAGSYKHAEEEAEEEEDTQWRSSVIYQFS